MMEDIQFASKKQIKEVGDELMEKYTETYEELVK